MQQQHTLLIGPLERICQDSALPFVNTNKINSYIRSHTKAGEVTQVRAHRLFRLFPPPQFVLRCGLLACSSELSVAKLKQDLNANWVELQA